MKDIESSADEFLRRVDAALAYNVPKATPILVSWRGGTYFGSLQNVYPEYSSEMVLLSKTSSSLNPGFVKGIEKKKPGIEILHADEKLDIRGRQHILRKIDNELTYMTDDQTKYAIKNPKVFAEFVLN